jgi:hypothetical protein
MDGEVLAQQFRQPPVAFLDLAYKLLHEIANRDALRGSKPGSSGHGRPDPTRGDPGRKPVLLGAQARTAASVQMCGLEGMTRIGLRYARAILPSGGRRLDLVPSNSLGMPGTSPRARGANVDKTGLACRCLDA